MSRKLVRADILLQVVADQDRVFSTRDVSEDDRVRQAHPALTRHSLYHAFIGGALSDHRDALGIEEIRKSTSRGSLWEKQGRSSNDRPPSRDVPAPAAVANTEESFDLGPQYGGDSPFKARMRLHQSWYRAVILRLPFGTGPTPNASSHYGNMLTREDGAAGRNFLTPEIAEIARRRVAQGYGTIEAYRLFHNMLSSQPMCLNIFGPLVNDPVRATRMIAALVPDPVTEVTRVAIEWAPDPAETYLADRTAFDVLIEYRTTDGRLCALGVETKLTEPFSQKEYDGERYRRWMRVPNAPWRPDADRAVHLIAHNQLWRDHLLAVALSAHPRSPYNVARLMLVHHPADRDCVRILEGYRQLLRDDDDSLLDMPLDRLIELWSPLVESASEQTWLSDLRLRYLDLDKSTTT